MIGVLLTKKKYRDQARLAYVLELLSEASILVSDFIFFHGLDNTLLCAIFSAAV